MKQFSPERSPIPENPEISVTRMLLLLSGFLLIVVFLLGVASLQFLPRFSVGQPIFFCIALLCLAFVVVRKYYRMRILGHIEHYRIAVTSEKIFSITSIDLPSSLVIKSIVNRKFIYIYMIGLSLAGVFFLMPPLIGILKVAGILLFLIITVITIAFLISLFAYAIVSLLKVEIMLEATEGSLQVAKGKGHTLKRHVNWNEACFFACYTLPNLLPGQKTMYYELSSSTQVLTWMSASDGRSPFTVWKPLISNEEHNYRMQILCDLITTRTGLVLHNLSELRERERELGSKH